MELLRLVVDGYPVLDETDYLHKLKICIQNKQALVLKDGDLLIGALAFSIPPCCIEFLGIHPQYRKRGIQKFFSGCVNRRLLSRTRYLYNNL